MLKHIGALILFLIIALIPKYSMNGTIEEPILLHDIERHVEIKLQQQNISEYKRFKNKLGFLESTNRYHVVSPSGSYMGRYQFGHLALTDIDMGHYNPNDFIQSKYLQEIALFKKLKRNELYLSSYIEHYDGHILSNGIQVTKSGILASAHLLGANTVKKYLFNDGTIEFRDGNHTPLSLYMEEFSGINFNLNKTIKTYIEENYDHSRYI